MRKAEKQVPPRSYFFFNLGCPKNLVDAEHTAGGLESAGWVRAASPDEASLLVVTTCAFIAIAEEESVGEILRVAAGKREDQLLAVLGCLVTREGRKLEELIPEVDIFLPVTSMDSLADLLDEGEKTHAFGGQEGPAAGAFATRRLFTPEHLAYLKIAEGCSNNCTYCMIPGIRGPLVSRDPEEIVEEARILCEGPVRELVVIAQDTTAWGMDRKGGEDLYSLLEMISAEARPEWVRLMYIHPSHADPARLSAAISSGTIIPYLDVPVQHSSSSVLKSMGRGYTAIDLDELFGTLRDKADDLVLRTTIMSGFPGETEEDHEALLDFLERHRFDHVGVFQYSPEPGTPAALLAETVDPKRAMERIEEIVSVQMDISNERLSSRISQRLTVIVDEVLEAEEKPSEDIWGAGRYFGQAYDVDGVTYLSGRVLKAGDMTGCRISSAGAYDLFAEVL